MAEYFASPTGLSSNPGTELSPFRPQDFYELPPQPGDILTLLDGTYQGPAFMLNGFSVGVDGTSAQPITIRAKNPGAALIDGQFANQPVRVRNSWWVLEDFNACNSPGTVVLIDGGSSNVKVRRVVAWDGNMTSNGGIFGIHSASFIRVEDCAGFGAARKVFSGSQSGNDITWVRCVGVWGGSTRVGPKQTFTAVYNNYRNKFIDCVGFWTGEDLPESYNLILEDGSVGALKTGFHVDQPYGIFGMDRMDFANKATDSGYFGGVALYRTADRFTPMIALLTAFGSTLDTYVSRHNVLFTQKDVRPLFLRDSGNGELFCTNATTIQGGSQPNSIGTKWTTTGLSAGTTVGGVADPFTASGTGANICKRRDDSGVATQTPRWPLPIEDRLFDAMSAAGAYTGPCTGCSGGRLTRTPIRVSDEIEAVFGPIPLSCKEAGSGGGPTFPLSENFPSVTTEKDTFTGVAGPLGVAWSTLTGAGWELDGNGNAIPSSAAFNIALHEDVLPSAMEVWGEIGVLPVEGSDSLTFQFWVQDANNRYVGVVNRRATLPDRVRIQKRIAGVLTTLFETDLPFEAKVGDAFGIRTLENGDIELHYRSDEFPNGGSLVVEATALTQGVGSATTSHVLALPTPVNAGDCIIVAMSGDTSGFARTNTWPGSWVKLVDAQDAGLRGLLTVGFLRASGGETSVTVTSSGSFRHAAAAYRISGCHATTNPEAATPTSGASGKPNPGPLNPAGWDVEDTLWLTAVGTASNGGGPYGCPTGYGSELYQTNDSVITAISSCRRALTAASDDPDDAAASLPDAWVATTIAVRPAGGGGVEWHRMGVFKETTIPDQGKVGMGGESGGFTNFNSGPEPPTEPGPSGIPRQRSAAASITAVRRLLRRL